MATTPKAKSTTTAVRNVAARKAPAKTSTVKPVTKVVAKSVVRPAPVKAVRKPVAVAKVVTAAAKSVPSKVQTVVAAPKKVKLVRDSFSFPEHEHALLVAMKKRALKLGKEFKKSEILRAGIAHLASLADGALVAMLSKVERVKAGRPAKKGKKK